MKILRRVPLSRWQAVALALIAFGSGALLFVLRDRALDFGKLPLPAVTAGVHFDPSRNLEGFPGHWLHGDEFLCDKVPDDATVTFSFVAPPLADALDVGYTTARDHGIFEVRLDGRAIGVINQRESDAARHRAFHAQAPGLGGAGHSLTFAAQGSVRDDDNNRLGVDGVVLLATGATAARARAVALAALLASLALLLLSRFGRHTLAAGLCVAGALLLFDVVPHGEPFRSDGIDVAGAGARTAWRLLPGGATYVGLRHGVFLAVMLAAMAILIAAHAAVGAGRVVWPRARTWLGLVALSPVMLAGLFPRPATWPMAAYQLLGTLAVLLITLGALLASPREPPSWPAALRRAAARAAAPARAVFDVPPRLFAVALFALSAAAAATLSQVLFQGVPHEIDSAVQLFHARVLASGHLTSPVPVQREFFDVMFMITDGDRWYAKYPPGHVAMLALGVLARAPFLVNPVLGAGAVLLVYLLARDLWGEHTGRVAGLLGLGCPFLQVMSAEYMNHATALFTIMLFIFAYRRVTTGGGLRWAALGGLALGWAAAARPLTALAMAVPFGIDLVSRLRAAPRRTLAIAAALGVAAAVPMTLFLLFNWRTNGSPFVSGYQKLHGAEHNPGFGHAAWGSPHTLSLGFGNLLSNLAALDKSLFEWPLPALALVLVPLVALPRRRWDWLLFGSGLGLGLAYVTYWYNDFSFGPRTVYEASGPFVMLTGKALAEMPAALARRWGTLRGRLVPAVGVATCLLVAVFGHAPPMARLLSHQYRNGDGHMIAEVRRRDIANAIVFVKDGYHSAFSQNAPSFKGSVIYAKNTDHNYMLRDMYPERACFVERDHLPVPCASVH